MSVNTVTGRIILVCGFKILKINVFWVVTLCSWVGRLQKFGRALVSVVETHVRLNMYFRTKILEQSLIINQRIMSESVDLCALRHQISCA